jgi:phenylpropionate dioxygenase-like ring-hydroxylating dioxygenase large terminal subunit
MSAADVKSPHPDMPFDVAGLIRRRSPGHALAREFYTDPRIFELDMDRILLRHWFCVGHTSSLPRAGDYLVVDLGVESCIIIKTHEGEIKALVNVCRHRGSRICTTHSGRAAAGLLTCPYHAWSYDLNGRLVAARQMGPDFDRDSSGLKSLSVQVIEGLIFTTFAEHPLDFAPAAAALAHPAGVHGWGKAKVAHQETYSMNANWKLAVENYMECYHCQPAHQEYSKHHTLARPTEQTRQMEREGRSRAEAIGISIGNVDQYAGAALPQSEYVSVFRSPLHEGNSGGTFADLRRAPLMGDFTDHDGNSTYFDAGPLSDFLAYPDHGVIYRFIPRAARHTEMEVIWLVNENAQEGRDYDLEQLTSLWKSTSLEDKKIVEWNQSGVNSRYFEPGPYSLQESYALRFVDWYLAELVEGRAPG